MTHPSRVDGPRARWTGSGLSAARRAERRPEEPRNSRDLPVPAGAGRGPGPVERATRGIFRVEGQAAVDRPAAPRLGRVRGVRGAMPGACSPSLRRFRCCLPFRGQRACHRSPPWCATRVWGPSCERRPPAGLSEADLWRLVAYLPSQIAIFEPIQQLAPKRSNWANRSERRTGVQRANNEQLLNVRKSPIFLSWSTPGESHIEWHSVRLNQSLEEL